MVYLDDNYDLINSLLVFLNSEKKFLDFLSILISKEIESTQFEQQIFRQNTPVTKLIISYMKYFAFDYLKDAILPTIEFILMSPDGFELNPTKISNGKIFFILSDFFYFFLFFFISNFFIFVLFFFLSQIFIFFVLFFLFR